MCTDRAECGCALNGQSDGGCDAGPVNWRKRLVKFSSPRRPFYAPSNCRFREYGPDMPKTMRKTQWAPVEQQFLIKSMLDPEVVAILKNPKGKKADACRRVVELYHAHFGDGALPEETQEAWMLRVRDLSPADRKKHPRYVLETPEKVKARLSGVNGVRTSFRPETRAGVCSPYPADN